MIKDTEAMVETCQPERSQRQRIICFFLPLARPLSIKAPTGFINPRTEEVKWLENANLPKPFTHPLFKSGKNFVSFTPFQAGGPRSIDLKPLQLAKIAAEGVVKGTQPGTSFKWEDDIDLGLGLAYSTLQMCTVLLDLDAVDDDAAIEAALARCFESLRVFELAYVTVSGDIAYPLTTIRSASSMCIYTVYDVHAQRWEEQSQLVINDTDVQRYVLPDEISDEQVEKIVQHTEISLAGLPFASVDYWSREAQQSCWYLGRYDIAAVQAFTAGEIFLDSVLMLLVWEEVRHQGSELTTAQIADWYSFNNNHAWRVNNQFRHRLRGWDDGPAPRPHEKWLDSAARIRSKVVHTGYLPSELEAETVIDCCQKIIEHVKRLLASDRNRTRYPRSALILLSEPGLERFDAYKGKTKSLFESEGNGIWVNDFVAFRSEIQSLIGSPPTRGTRQDVEAG